VLTIFAKTAVKDKIYYATVIEKKQVMGYDYLKVNENEREMWVAIAVAPVNVGDKIGYDKKTVMQNFRSKSLGRTFKSIVFANKLYLFKEPKKHETMKSMLFSNSSKIKNITKKKIDKHFVKKEFYTVEEVHMFAKELENQIISVKATIHKIAPQIMKRDWVHLNDKTGNDLKNTDDLVATTKHASVKVGDKVIVTGKVAINKDFGYGYFYPVIIEKASFK